MRIAVVSSHYPPDFVSGGTLVPQRIAEGLSDLGHHVEVFAGAINSNEPQSWMWSETAPHGITVHRIAIPASVDWASDLNFADPAAEAAFAEFLAVFRPDVVHMHSLQGFGGALATIAKASGAAVVITMHDMWWFCARQFLAEKSLQPCSPVVSCGVCPCERNNDWLVGRNDTLSRHLANADLVLAPSRTMMRLLEANGVDAGRLELDENHAHHGAAPVQDRRPPGPRDETTFVYAGGPHPLKGAGVVLEAARLLDDLPGWRLDLVGMDVPSDLEPRVCRRPPYAPELAGQVLAEYDVLLMPSPATESYSLITREALNAGTVVVTGHNPGPMEVVQPGVNGLVVPRADPVALSESMRRLVTDRQLLERLRPVPGAIPLRSLGDQLDGLLRRYEKLLSAKRSEGRTRGDEAPSGAARRSLFSSAGQGDRPIRRVLLLTGINGAPLRYRGRLPQEALAPLGVRMDVRVYRDIEAPVLARTADAVVIYRSPATEQLLDLIDMVRARPEGVPVLFDIDDLVVDPGIEPEIRDLLAHLPAEVRADYWRGVHRYRTTLEACDGYVGSTRTLCERIGALSGIPTYRFANGVGVQLGRLSDAYLRLPREAGPLRIGYFSGTDTHNQDWESIEPAVIDVLRARPDVELWLGGLLRTGPALEEMAARVRRIPLLPWTELPGVLRNLDLNLAPLRQGGPFNECKSAIKWLEAALVRTPTVASPTEPFREAMQVPGPERTGLLADGHEQWVTGILQLLDDAALRQRIGYAAYDHALLTHSPGRQGPRYLKMLERARDRVREHGHREQFASGWEPVYDSEAYVPVAPEGYGSVPLPYIPHPWEPERRNLRRIAADYRTTTWRHLRREGPVATARKTAHVLAGLPGRARGRLG